MLLLSQVENAINEIFDDTRIQMVDSVFEDSGDYYKLVYSLHNLDVEVEEEENTIIVHTKIYFKVDKSKKKLIENSLWYLFDINCNYEKVEFGDSDINLKESMEDILMDNSFGKNIKAISLFIAKAPASSINDYLNKRDVRNFTVTSVEYNPKFKMFPCESTQFDFNININNGEYNIILEIKKTGNEQFNFYYKILDDVKVYEHISIAQLPQEIGNNLIDIMGDIL